MNGHLHIITHHAIHSDFSLSKQSNTFKVVILEQKCLKKGLSFLVILSVLLAANRPEY